MKRLHILLADDRPAILENIRVILAPHHEIVSHRACFVYAPLPVLDEISIRPIFVTGGQTKGEPFKGRQFSRKKATAD